MTACIDVGPLTVQCGNKAADVHHICPVSAEVRRCDGKITRRPYYIGSITRSTSFSRLLNAVLNVDCSRTDRRHGKAGKEINWKEMRRMNNTM